MPTLHLTSKRNQRDFPWPDALLAAVEEPTWPEIEAALRSASAKPGPLYLTGGEPTMRRDLFTLMNSLAHTFPARDLVLVSNGRLFCYQRVCDALAAVRSDQVTVEVWIASMRAEVHDRLVGGAQSFAQTTQGVDQLLARGLRTRLRIPVGRHNVEHLHQIAASIPDRFAGIDAVVWDIAALAGPDGGDLRQRPDEVSSYLESAVNLLRVRQTRTVMVGLPLCSLSDKYRDYLDRAVIGGFRDDCAACHARTECPGLVGAFAADEAVRVRPIVPTTDADATAAYEDYLIDLLGRYVPAIARAAPTILDSMCGQSLRNLAVLRRFFRDADTVHGTDIDLDPKTKAPAGTQIRRADLLQPLDGRQRYTFVALFKPPGDEPQRPIRRVLSHLVATMEPGGHLLIVLAEHTDVDHVLDVLRGLDVVVLTSELNALRSTIEAEHKWVIVCRAGA